MALNTSEPCEGNKQKRVKIDRNNAPQKSPILFNGIGSFIALLFLFLPFAVSETIIYPEQTPKTFAFLYALAGITLLFVIQLLWMKGLSDIRITPFDLVLGLSALYVAIRKPGSVVEDDLYVYQSVCNWTCRVIFVSNHRNLSPDRKTSFLHIASHFYIQEAFNQIIFIRVLALGGIIYTNHRFGIYTRIKTDRMKSFNRGCHHPHLSLSHKAEIKINFENRSG